MTRTHMSYCQCHAAARGSQVQPNREAGVRSVPRRWRRASIAAALVLAALAPAVAGCADDGSASTGGEDRIEVATTVAPITSIVANIVGDRVDDHRHRPGGHELPHVRAEAERRPSCSRRPTSSTSTASSSRSRRRSSPRRTSRTAPRSSSSAPQCDPRGASTSTTSRSRGRAASRTRTCGPTRRTRSATPRSSATTCPSATRTTPSYYAANYDAFAAMVDEFDAAMRTSFATIPPQAQAAHLPRRLRLLRARTTAGT